VNGTLERSHLRDVSFNYVYTGDPSSRTTMIDEIDIRSELWEPKKDDVVFDVGAAYGSYSLPAAAAGADVYAFEPFPELIEGLQQNIEANGFQNIHVCPFALGAESGKKLVDIYRPKPPIEMQVEALDGVFDGLKLKRLDWVKVDTEGMEMDVLAGGFKTIKRYHPTLILEIHTFMPGIALGEAIEAMMDFGYQEIKQRDRNICRMLYARMLG